MEASLDFVLMLLGEAQVKIALLQRRIEELEAEEE